MNDIANSTPSYPKKKVFSHLNLLGMKSQKTNIQGCESDSKYSGKGEVTKINVRSLVLSPERRSKFLKASLSPMKIRLCPQKEEFLKENQKLNSLYKKDKNTIHHFYDAEKSAINNYSKGIFNSNLLTNKLIKQKLKIVNTNKERDHFGDKKPSSTTMSFYPNAISALNESNINTSNITSIPSNQFGSNGKILIKKVDNNMNRSQSLLPLRNKWRKIKRNEKCSLKEIPYLTRSKSCIVNGIKNYNDLLKPAFKTTSHAIINVNAFRSKIKLKDIYGIDNDIIKTFNKSYFSTRYFEGFDFNKLKMDGYEIVKKADLIKN